MAVKAGELRHRVTIQQYDKGERNDDGFYLQPGGWTTLKTVWAKITPLSTKDLLTAQAAQSEITARMKVRYRTGKGIDTTMRVIWQGRTYAIDSQGMEDSDTGLEYMTFALSKGVEKFKD
ncbi:phage head closure protein [Psychrobacter sp. A3]|uniref:phage head closure protein n=1 Tax=Psychrobacter sp. A3 TaxID=2992754 RepID=UPI00237BC78A|nr:phage head closure protein [Psychrobacter sp. A3]MDE0490000.1 phage head closure protein [Psychrobacter sp. A3]